MSYRYPPQKRLNDAINRVINTFLSVGKIALKSRPVKPLPVYSGKPAFVIGAAKSLKAFADAHGAEELDRFELFVTNNFAGQPIYESMKPKYYVIFDPVFWSTEGYLPELVEKGRNTWQALIEKTTWQLHLLMPREAMSNAFVQAQLQKNPNIIPFAFNSTVYYGNQRLGFWLWHKRVALPPMSFSGNLASFLAILMGAPEIYMVGIENSYTKYLEIDEENTLWVNKSYINLGGADIYKDRERMPHDLSLFLWHIQRSNDNFGVLSRFAKKRGQNLYNATPNSIIDTVERKPLPSTK